MRTLFRFLILSGSALSMVACSPSFDASYENNRQAIGERRADIISGLADTSERSGDLASAERYYAQWVESSNHSPEAAIQMAAFYNRHGEAGRAEKLLEASLAKNPQNLELLRAVANHHIMVGETEQALNILQDGIAHHGSEAYLYNSKGVALDQLGRHSEAQDAYLKAVSLSPSDAVDFKTNLSMSYLQSGNAQKAIALLKPIKGDHNATATTRINLALAYGLSGDMLMASSVAGKDISAADLRQSVSDLQKNMPSRLNDETPASRPGIVEDDEPEADEPEEKIAEATKPEPKPLPAPAISKPVKAAPATQVSVPVPADEGDIEEEAEESGKAPKNTMGIPTPVLKPDKW